MVGGKGSKMTFSETVRTQIREILDSNGIKHSEIARELGVSKPSVSIALREGSRMSLQYVDRIEAAVETILARRVDAPKKITAGFYPNGLRHGRAERQ